jgi:acyl-coenzyme A thioesterase PaaI-like protein
MRFKPRHRGFENRLRDAFTREPAVIALAARLLRVVPGEVTIEVPYREALGQAGDSLRAGVVAAALESACSYAAFTLMPVEATVLTVDFKLDVLAPARGHGLFVLGRVLRAGCNACTCQAEGYMRADSAEKQVALMTATVMVMRGPAQGASGSRSGETKAILACGSQSTAAE